MANLLIEGLDEAAMGALWRRAERHGVSVESEAREILQAVVMRSESGSTGWATQINARFAQLDMPEFEHLDNPVR